MIQITPHMRILVAVEPVDFRAGIDALVAVCRKRLQADPFSGALFVFGNRARTGIKIVVYERVWTKLSTLPAWWRGYALRPARPMPAVPRWTDHGVPSGVERARSKHECAPRPSAWHARRSPWQRPPATGAAARPAKCRGYGCRGGAPSPRRCRGFVRWLGRICRRRLWARCRASSGREPWCRPARPLQLPRRGPARSPR